MLGTVIIYTIPSTETEFCPELLGDGLSEILDSINLGYPGLFQDINIVEVAGMHFIKKHL